MVRPVVTRVERYAGHCPCIPAGLEDGSPFSMNIVALAIYLRFTHAISYRRLTQLLLNLYALQAKGEVARAAHTDERWRDSTCRRSSASSLPNARPSRSGRAAGCGYRTRGVLLSSHQT